MYMKYSDRFLFLHTIHTWFSVANAGILSCTVIEKYKKERIKIKKKRTPLFLSLCTSLAQFHTYFKRKQYVS